MRNTSISVVLSLARQIDLSWNTLEPSLILVYEKLTDLDWVYHSGEVHIVKPAPEESYRHGLSPRTHRS